MLRWLLFPNTLPIPCVFLSLIATINNLLKWVSSFPNYSKPFFSIYSEHPLLLSESCISSGGWRGHHGKVKWALLVTVESPPATSEAPDRWEMSLVCVFTTFASAALLLIVVLMFSETESSQVSRKHAKKRTRITHEFWLFLKPSRWIFTSSNQYVGVWSLSRVRLFQYGHTLKK